MTRQQTTRTLRQEGGEGAAERRPRPGLLLLFSEGATPGVRGFSCAGDLTLGRHPDRHIMVEDPGLSRHHATVRSTDAGLRLRDEGSHNGTFVNGEPVRQELALEPGDVVRCGATLLLAVPDVGLYAGWPASAQVEPLLGGPAMAEVRRRVELVAPLPCHVMVRGESGTGKELVAGLLHQQSGRTGRHVQFNCAALAESLADAELFGARKGSYTGAVADRPGLLQDAHGGTLMLDEVGELPPALQPKLLRALEQGEVRALGSSRPVRVDLRVVSATHRDLEAMQQNGSFRKDLYNRLCGNEVWLPPLRQRREDIVLLALRQLERSPVANGNAFGMSTLLLERLLLLGWPGNVRELYRVLEAIMVEARIRGVQRLLPEHLSTGLRPEAEDTLLARVRQALTGSKGNVVEAAHRLGLTRGHVYRVLRENGLKPGSFR